MSQKEDTEQKIKIFESPILNSVSENQIQHGFFTRLGGVSVWPYSSLNLSFTKKGDPVLNAIENANRVSKWFSVASSNLVLTREVHSNIVIEVNNSFEPGGSGSNLPARPEADGLLTCKKGLVLGMIAADCIPVLIYYKDPEKPAVSAIHAGWKGALNGVVQNAIKLISEKFESIDLSHVYLALGPCIRQSSYEVDDPLRKEFLAQDPNNDRYFLGSPPARSGHYYFDLPGFVKGILFKIGVPESNIDDLNLDTFTRPDEFFSCRGMKYNNEPDFGNQISCIMLKSS